MSSDYINSHHDPAIIITCEVGRCTQGKFYNLFGNDSWMGRILFEDILIRRILFESDRGFALLKYNFRPGYVQFNCYFQGGFALFNFHFQEDLICTTIVFKEDPSYSAIIFKVDSPCPPVIFKEDLTIIFGRFPPTYLKSIHISPSFSKRICPLHKM